MPEAISTAEVMQKLALSLKSIKDELQKWHEESKRNGAAIANLTKRLEMLSQKTATSPEIQSELNLIKAKIESISLQPVVGGNPEAKTILENELAKINQEITQIKSIQLRMNELSSKSDEGDRKIQEQIRALKEHVTELPRSTPSTEKQGEEFLTALQKDLEEWHKESMENTRELTALLKRLQTIESKTEVDVKVKKDLERVMTQLENTSGSIGNFEELRKTIQDHTDEFKEIYSTLGKERVELDSVNGTIVSLQSKLLEWSTRNKENLEEVTDIRKDLAALTKEIKSKDLGGKVDEISSGIHDLADRVESLQRQEQQLQEMQEQLVEFDQGLKELVRKAVIASLSKKEFEEELDKLETKTGKPTKLSTAPATPAKPATPPKAKDVKAKMRQLRAALEAEKGESGVKDIFADFEKEINTAGSNEEKNMLWDNLRNDVSATFNDSITCAKKKIEEAKTSGTDVSKLNLLVAKTDIGLVSMETSISLRNIVKTKEIIEKLDGLKSQIETQLGN